MAYVDNLTMLLLMVESRFDTLSFVVQKLHLLQLHFSSFEVFERKPSFGNMYPAHFTHFSADMYVPNSVGSQELRKNETYSKFATVESSFFLYIRDYFFKFQFIPRLRLYKNTANLPYNVYMYIRRTCYFSIFLFEPKTNKQVQ